MPGELAKLLSDLKEPEALGFVEKALGQGVDPLGLLQEAKEGMNAVGQRFAGGEYFIPDLVFSGEILRGIVKMIEPHLKEAEEAERLGKVIVGTVAGDIHDIGKDLVVFMLDVNGLKSWTWALMCRCRNSSTPLNKPAAKWWALAGF